MSGSGMKVSTQAVTWYTLGTHKTLCHMETRRRDTALYAKIQFQEELKQHENEHFQTGNIGTACGPYDIHRTYGHCHDHGLCRLVCRRNRWVLFRRFPQRRGCQSGLQRNTGHDELHYMNGWTSSEATRMTTLHTISSFDGQACYCIEPGVPRLLGTIDADTIKTLPGRIMQYGYQGDLSTSWRSQNDADADKPAHLLTHPGVSAGNGCQRKGHQLQPCGSRQCRRSEIRLPHQPPAVRPLFCLL